MRITEDNDIGVTITPQKPPQSITFQGAGKLFTVHPDGRIERVIVAGPSEVLVSRTVKDLVAGSGIAFADRGLHHLKGVPDEWRLFAAG